MQPSCDLLCVICDAAIVLLLMLRRGKGEGVCAKLKSYSVGQAATMLLALNLFYRTEKYRF